MSSKISFNADSPLHELGENVLVHELLRGAPSHPDLLVGPGDDCAVLAGDADWDLLLKTDVVVEGVHFLRESPPALLGRKALARAISDMAAMGGIPHHALITLLAHPSRSFGLLDAIYHEGIFPLAQCYGISLAGGETSSLPYDGLVINVSLTGKVERGQAVLRSGAKVGDLICVSGKLGGSFPSGRHLSFEPRLDLARFLMQSGLAPHAMMDLSDGLAVDLPRLCAASACSYELALDRIPCHDGCTPQQALEDGEDYELLMCLGAEQWARIQSLPLPTPLSVIGAITPLGHQGGMSGGWTHFTNTR